MYSIKLEHGQGMTLGDTIDIIKTVHANLIWEDEDGTKTTAARTDSWQWSPKTATWADKHAWKIGMELKAEYGAYLRKHGERLEVVRDRERKAKKAEQERLTAIKKRCYLKWDVIIAALKEPSPALAHYLETGEEWKEVALEYLDNLPDFSEVPPIE